MTRLSFVATAALALAGVPSAFVVAQADEPTRDAHVLGAFQSFCLKAEPDYAAGETAAGALGLVSLGDHTQTLPDGRTVKGHRFGGKLPDGPFALYLSDVTSKEAVEASCGVSGPVTTADGFRDAMVRDLTLPPLPNPAAGPSGSTIYIWKDYPSRGHRLILQTGTEKNGEGVVLVTLAATRKP